MADDMSPEEAMAAQKANCIFCKIAAGEIPSKKIYDDDRMLAFLDINPAVPGHTLVATKEHYPIMPLIPPDEFTHLFGHTPMLASAIMQGMLTPHCTVFIANGGVAGQQSPHFLFHMIPRDENDNLSSLHIPQNGINQSDLAPMIQQNLYSVMREHLTKTNKAHLLQTGSPPPQQTPQPTPQEKPPQPPVQSAPPSQPTEPSITFGQLAKMLDENPDIRSVLEHDPDRLEAILEDNPELKSLFGGIDLRKLSGELRRIDPDFQPAPEVAAKPPAPAVNETPPPPPHEQIVPASQLTINQIFDFIEQKPKLRDLILNDPQQLKELIKTNERLALFFEGIDPDSIIEAYRRHKGDHDAL